MDTSLGAQFHQTCLYWGYPSLPGGIESFPRDQSQLTAQAPQGSFSSFGQIHNSSLNNSNNSSGSNSYLPLAGIRMEQKVLDAMFSEW